MCRPFSYYKKKPNSVSHKLRDDYSSDIYLTAANFCSKMIFIQKLSLRSKCHQSKWEL